MKEQNIIFIIRGGTCSHGLHDASLSQDKSVIGSSKPSDVICQFFISSIVRTSFLFIATFFPSRGSRLTYFGWQDGRVGYGCRGSSPSVGFSSTLINSNVRSETDFQPENTEKTPTKQKPLHKNKPQHGKWIGEVLKNRRGK